MARMKEETELLTRQLIVQITGFEVQTHVLSSSEFWITFTTTVISDCQYHCFVVVVFWGVTSLKLGPNRTMVNQMAKLCVRVNA